MYIHSLKHLDIKSRTNTKTLPTSMVYIRPGTSCQLGCVFRTLQSSLSGQALTSGENLTLALHAARDAAADGGQLQAPYDRLTRGPERSKLKVELGLVRFDDAWQVRTEGVHSFNLPWTTVEMVSCGKWLFAWLFG